MGERQGQEEHLREEVPEARQDLQREQDGRARHGGEAEGGHAEVGVSCDKINSSNRTLKKEGVPGMKTTKKGSNVCFKSRVGNPTTCNKQIGDGKFRSLCWCE